MKDREQIISSTVIAFEKMKATPDITLHQAIDELTRAILDVDYEKKEKVEAKDVLDIEV